MGVESICIDNYKSLKHVKVNMQKGKYDIQCFIGKNGTGKSNFLDAVNYFYDCMNNKNNTFKVIDQINTYVQKLTIEFVYNFEQLLKNNTNDYYEKILMDLDKYIVNKKIALRLVQYKDGSMEWYPNESLVRKSIHKLFPLYMVDTRFISLEDWSELWSIISDISQAMGKIDIDKFQNKLNDLYESMYGDKYSKTISKIQNILSKEKIGVNSYDFGKQYRNVLISRFGGIEFANDGNNLNYYSDGLNSLKYIKLVLRLISELSDTGWKNPIILLDEPEIGLHPHYIDELVDTLIDSNKKNVDIIISTHSNHLVSELVKSDIKTCIQRIYYKNNYSYIEKMKDIMDDIEKYLVNDMVTDTYFSNAVVFVEGKTEIQVFKNPNIIKLFPQIKKAKLYSFNSDNATLKMAYPDYINIKIPFLTIVDMDKILIYQTSNKHFKYKNDRLFNPLVNERVRKRQRYYFYSECDLKKEYTYNLSQRIDGMIKRIKVELSRDNYWINDRWYDRLLKFIKIYCLQFNMYPLTTTIEGIIVCENNVDIVIEWLGQKLDQNTMNKLNTLIDNNVKKTTTILRLILNGKLDFQLTLKEYNIDIKDEIKKINKCIGNKVSGWVCEFINYYFEKYINILDNLEDKRNRFSKNFVELDFILHYIEDMIK